ncbi:hypothetical protein ELI02_27575 (plasmid) [Rhizobium leguminosarum]|uniref:Uncharacterized protein n=1 Tax=Rhizobium leguminosarum TaxID=384 RepID=A0A4Q8XY24_RHILE|nr:hypothetical protein ELI22_34715 [Rhizobium leguminosarum]TAV82179.1 hypothetical protein ELI21_33020 [Rhizobium leguminosarum]TAW25905.1 hypothetical protein ELI23_31630 [Rhizobium leguminosarum]TAX23192.1 hypothetical protein ELI04_30030 [Rhizobium leguminosarum]TAX46851.1 hypothetical protein ELI02_27575 [Rhizobium leguminosarum]
MNKVGKRSSRTPSDRGTLLELDRPDSDLTACAAFEAYYLCVNPNWSIAMDQSAIGTLSESYIEILPPDRDEKCASGGTACPCCRRLRPASSMDDDGCGICDECLAP